MCFRIRARRDSCIAFLLVFLNDSEYKNAVNRTRPTAFFYSAFVNTLKGKINIRDFFYYVYQSLCATVESFVVQSVLFGA